MILNNRIELAHVDWEDLGFDIDLFLEIQEDLRKNSNDHAPIEAWQKRGGGGDQAVDLERFHFQHVLQGWFGFGKNTINRESLFWWMNPLIEVDELGLVDQYFDFTDDWHCRDDHQTISDLGTMWDINLMTSCLESFGVNSPTIVEIGGGFGRLAEAFFSVYPAPIKYVMVDSVPASLMYAYLYLKKALIGKKVGIYCRDDRDMRDYDVYIVPSWHFEKINQQTYDLAINVQSMQEMHQHHVDYYFSLLNRITRQGGLIYLCNRRDHRFKGSWNIPNNWQCLLKCMCPRSWDREFPSEIYANSCGDYRKLNNIIDAQYRRNWTQAAARQMKQANEIGYRAY